MIIFTLREIIVSMIITEFVRTKMTITDDEHDLAFLHHHHRLKNHNHRKFFIIIIVLIIFTKNPSSLSTVNSQLRPLYSTWAIHFFTLVELSTSVTIGLLIITPTFELQRGLWQRSQLPRRLARPCCRRRSRGKKPPLDYHHHDMINVSMVN